MPCTCRSPDDRCPSCTDAGLEERAELQKEGES